MPVLDHPVSDKVKHDKPPAGCYSRMQMEDGYYVLVRDYLHDGRYEFRDQWIPHTMSTQCRQISNLPECEGCTAEKDVEYLEQMRNLK